MLTFGTVPYNPVFPDGSIGGYGLANYYSSGIGSFLTQSKL